MESKQTAIEWLKLQLEEYGDPQYCELTWKELDELCEQAKQMEENQIRLSYVDGFVDGDTDRRLYKDSKVYYNENYGK